MFSSIFKIYCDMHSFLGSLLKNKMRFIVKFIIIAIMIYLFCFVDLIKENQTEDINKKSDFFKKTEIKNQLQKNKRNIFSEDFSENFVLEETGNMKRSKSDDWWVNSGAFLYSENGIGRTIFGKLEKEAKWRINYRDYNSDETDNGYHPQNIFRLITKSKWKNFNQQVYFNIKKYNISESKHRFESNGLLLFNRYQNSNNLYYTGLRVDGAIVIKKKYKGKYYLMGYKKILKGKYNRKDNPSLILQNKWIGIKSKIKTVNNNQLEIKVYTDIDKTGNWKEVLNAIDDGKKYGGKIISNEGYAGIRTDFMDVKFDDYKIEEI